MTDLGAKQTQILRLMAKGLRDIEIAQEMKIHRNTIHSHMEYLKRKFSIHSRVLLAFHVLQLGIVTQEEINHAIEEEMQNNAWETEYD